MRDRLKEVSGAMCLKPVESKAAKLAGAKDEAAEALVSLGYKPSEADKMIRSLDSEGLTTEDLIKLALQRH